MTLLLACGALAMAWIVASGVAALTLGRMLRRAEDEESRRFLRASQAR